MPTKTRADYTGRTIHFGLDYHKKSWTIHPLDGKVKGKAYTIVKPTAKELHRRLQLTYPNGTFIGVYEAGFGGYGLIRELKLHDIVLNAVHAADVPVTDKERQQKNDPSDAFRLAKLARSEDYEAVYVPTPKQEAFRQLVRRRADIVKSTTRVKVKIKSHLVFRNRVPEALQFEDWRFSKKRLAELESLAHQVHADDDMPDYILRSLVKELRNYQLEKLVIIRQLRQLVKQLHADLYPRLLGCPGIGPIVAMTLIGEILDMDRFASFNKLCAYVGLIGKSHNSGEKEVNGSLVSRGNKRLRTLLVEASWQAKRKDPALELYYSRLVNDEKMKPNMAIIKVAQKLLSRIRYVWTSGEEYEKGIL